MAAYNTRAYMLCRQAVSLALTNQLWNKYVAGTNPSVEAYKSDVTQHWLVLLRGCCLWGDFLRVYVGIHLCVSI